MPDPSLTPPAAAARDADAIHVNGQPLPWSPDLSVADVLLQRGDAPGAVATALNGGFVARAQRPHTPLQPGDSLSIVEAIVGG